MSLLNEAIKSDSGLFVAAKYLIDVVAPFFEMPLTGDTQKVHDFQLERRIGELEALIFRIAPSPSGLHRTRYLSEQLMEFALESGAPLGSDESFVAWVMKNGSLEDRVMETAFEIDLLLDSAFNVSTEVQEISAIRKNMLVNFSIFQDLQQVMMSGGPGSVEELEAFEKAVETNLTKARKILGSFDYV